MLGYLCENTNFKPCRLIGVYENNDCDNQLIFNNANDPIISDIVFLILALIVFIFFAVFIKTYIDIQVKFQGQTATRAVLAWRMHIILHGVRILVQAIYTCLTIVDGSTMHVVMVLYYVVFNWTQALLVYITFVDMHICSDTTLSKIIGIVVSLIVGCLAFLMYLNEFCIILFSMALPLGCSLFHTLAMIPVGITRQKPLIIVYSVLMFVFILLSVIFELFVNGPICSVSKGWLTGMTLSLICFSFYRVFSSQMYVVLKKDEYKDGIKPGAPRLDAPVYEDMNKPALIEQDDYSYSYTYTEESE